MRGGQHEGVVVAPQRDATVDFGSSANLARLPAQARQQSLSADSAGKTGAVVARGNPAGATGAAIDDDRAAAISAQIRCRGQTAGSGTDDHAIDRAVHVRRASAPW